MASQYKDRFSEAEHELTEKSAYICTSCDNYYSGEKNKKRTKLATPGHSQK